MESLNPGTTVYFCWYDFQQKKEYTLTGEVVDNSDWGSTQWQDYVNVRFHPPGMKAVICHHFLPERLSTDQNNVPHDDCYLMLQPSVPSAEAQPQQKPKDNPWLQMTEFKKRHWDTEHNHIHVDALDEFYRLWRIAINWRIVQKIKEEYTQYPQYPEHPFAPEWTDWNNVPNTFSVGKTIADAIETLERIHETKKNPEVTQLDLFS